MIPRLVLLPSVLLRKAPGCSAFDFGQSVQLMAPPPSAAECTEEGGEGLGLAPYPRNICTPNPYGGRRHTAPARHVSPPTPFSADTPERASPSFHANLNPIPRRSA
eukprot:1177672-Prorocentrum_minimum.AAC.2